MVEPKKRWSSNAILELRYQREKHNTYNYIGNSHKSKDEDHVGLCAIQLSVRIESCWSVSARQYGDE